jgi:S1-C subfamily serine protease
MKTNKVVVTLLLLSSVYLHADSIPEIVKKAKPAILEIVAMDERGSPVKQGTGFFISSDGLAVTNFHVIQCAGSLTAIDDHGAFFILEKIVSQPKGIDIAILKFRVH